MLREIHLSARVQGLMVAGLDKAIERLKASRVIAASEDLDITQIDEELAAVGRMRESAKKYSAERAEKTLPNPELSTLVRMAAAFELSARHDEELLESFKETGAAATLVEQLSARRDYKRRIPADLGIGAVDADATLERWGFKRRNNAAMVLETLSM